MNEYYPASILKLPHATPETSDAAQFMIYKGRKQFNLCGELSVAYTMQDEAHTDNIDDFLAYWEAKELSWFQAVFKNGLGRTTGIYDLNKMLAAYGVPTPCLSFGSVLMIPARIQTQLINYQAIIGVQIDHSGYLVGQGIPHWVVLESIIVIDNSHAICSVYNPFSNNIEPYSWKEVMTSTGAYKQGIWVPR